MRINKLNSAHKQIMQETLLSFSQQQQQQPTGSNQKQKEIDGAGEIQLLIPTRGRLLASRTRSQPSSRRVTPTRGDIASSSDRETESDELLVALDVEQEKKEEVEEEQVLPNGDMYTGSLPGGVPHGTGKYLWSDGCMYEGEWSRGRASGYGKFSWPSGATYEGHFKSGRMDGLGTFIGVHGDSFKGSWLSDSKHGFGEKRYPNGDVYRGYWKFNLQDGQGSYRWSNGNEYVGQWRNGVIHGKGFMIWANGNKYEGYWENGVPVPMAKEKGFFFTFANVNGKSDYCTNYYASELLGNFGKQDAWKRSSVDAKIPRICIWELDGDAGDITCDIVDSVEASMLYGDSDGDGNCNCNCNCAKVSTNGGAAEAGQLQRTSVDGEVKKAGQTISRGHKNYDLMLKLQLGIRHSVSKHASMMRELKQSDFDPKEKFWTRFPPEGSKFTPPHQSLDFRWKDYCPMVFKHLRELFAIDPVDYMLAICGTDTLSEFSSPGKSGSFFYLTQDDRFMVKTVKKSEVKVLIRMLPSYYQHVCQFKNSLVTKFFGVHCVKPVGGQKTRFIVMGNLFCSEYRIHKRFDLKGSSYGRITDKDGGQIDETTTLKDLDLNYVFHLERTWFQELIRQINRDCEFLEAEGIMDYSLLIGIHFRDYPADEVKVSSKNLTFEEANIKPEEKSMRGYHLLPNMDWVMEGQGPLIRLGANVPARAEHVSRVELDHYTGAVSYSGRGELFEVILYFGIIDILQDYDISKKLEHAYKSLQVDPTCISAVDPKLYSKRFRDFIHRIFVEDRKTNIRVHIHDPEASWT